MIETIKHRPHKVLLYLSTFFGSIGLIIWKYDHAYGYSSTNQDAFEEFFRLVFGSMLLYIPFFLVYALVYWLMHKFNRPTYPKLNLLHMGLLFLSIIIYIGYGYSIISSDSIVINYETSISEYLIGILSLSVVVVFIVNIILSLIKPREKLD